MVDIDVLSMCHVTHVQRGSKLAADPGTLAYSACCCDNHDLRASVLLILMMTMIASKTFGSPPDDAEDSNKGCGFGMKPRGPQWSCVRCQVLRQYSLLVGGRIDETIAATKDKPGPGHYAPKVCVKFLDGLHCGSSDWHSYRSPPKSTRLVGVRVVCTRCEVDCRQPAYADRKVPG
eukprot:519017-Amphidinium_carterae.1